MRYGYEKIAHGCNFGTKQDERILEHLIQTIENQTLIQKYISKAWILEEFLSEAGQIKDISEQVHDMKTDTWSKEIAKVAERRGYSTWKNSDSSEWGQRTEHCTYCGLSRAHPKGRSCPAYGVLCEICKKVNHFSSVSRANTSPAETRDEPPVRHGRQKKERVKKAEENFRADDAF